MDRPAASALDRYLPEDIRRVLEERFWHAVEETSTIEALALDGAVEASSTHPALFSDHGVIHARDVAAGTLELEELLDGRLLPARPPERREFVAALGVLIAYVHDVGMNDVTQGGRNVHSIYAAQLPFAHELDDVVARLWAAQGPVVSRVQEVGVVEPFRAKGEVVLRELVALAVGHSKSVLADGFTDSSRLRRALQRAVFVELEDHRRLGARLDPDEGLPSDLGSNARWYDEPITDSFAWLDAPGPAQQALATDAVDAMRLVRVADALRQRGSALRTAAGYEVFIDVATGHAVFALRTAAGDQLFLIRLDSPLSAGEANIRKAVLTRSGDLRISFHRGRFSSAGAAASAVASTARVVADIGTDVLGAFAAGVPAGDLPEPACDPAAMRIELERPADESTFADTVAAAVARLDPRLHGRLRVVADLESTSPVERERYLRGTPIGPESAEAADILAALDRHGVRVGGIDRRAAFEDVRRVRVEAGETLVEAGSSPSFVYVAVGCRLHIEQPGGYGDVDVAAWIPIGVTGVVRRAERNSTVIAVGTGDVLMIPGELYAREWFRPYEQFEFGEVLARVSRA